MINKDSAEYVVPNEKQPVFRAVKPILRLFFKRPELILTAGEIAPGSLIVSNHGDKKGPMVMELYRPTFYVPWGASPMLGNYASRYHYLRNVLYVQKKGYSKIIATPLAAFEALFSIFFYKGMRVLPTYHDARMTGTVKKSVKCMENGVSVLVFPEMSEDGYFELMSAFHPGFVLPAQTYARRNGRNCTVYPMYYHAKKRKLIVGAPVSIAKLNEIGLDKEEIAEYFRIEVNALCHKYALGTPDEMIPRAEGSLAEKIAAYEAKTAPKTEIFDSK